MSISFRFGVKMLCFFLFSVVISMPVYAKFYSGILQNSAYRVCFSPKNHCENRIVKAINQAKSTIDMQAYSFTSKPIANALIAAQKRGVKVSLLLDRSNFREKYSVLKALIMAHVPLLIDWKPAIANNKILILDNDWLLTGSYNFTRSANTRNAENVLLIQNAALAKRYLQNFKVRQRQSETVGTYCHYHPRCGLSVH